MMAGLRTRIAATARRFLKDLRGVSATEFALVAPVLIAFYFGTAEIDSALSVNRKVTSAANTAADLVAQDDIMTAAEFDAVFTAVDAIMAPFDPNETIEVKISSIRLNGQNRAAVVWGVANNTAARQVGTTVTIPSGLVSGTSTIILAEVSFPYQAPLAEIISSGGVRMSETFYLRPRRGASVCRVVSATSTVC